MANKRILMIDKDEKFLREKSASIPRITKTEKRLFQDIKDTIDANPAVGLAAVQIGVHKRVFGIRLNYEPGQEDKDMSPTTIFVNPEYVTMSEDQEREYDACLSIPGVSGDTDRCARVQLRYLDENGAQQEQEFAGYDARAIQHEMDHLDGVLFLDRLKSKDDLYVHVEDKNGRIRRVRYTSVKRQADDEAGNPKLDPGVAAT